MGVPHRLIVEPRIWNTPVDSLSLHGCPPATLVPATVEGAVVLRGADERGLLTGPGPAALQPHSVRGGIDSEARLEVGVVAFSRTCTLGYYATEYIWRTLEVPHRLFVEPRELSL